MVTGFPFARVVAALLAVHFGAEALRDCCDLLSVYGLQFPVFGFPVVYGSMTGC